MKDQNRLFVYGTLRVHRGIPWILEGSKVIETCRRIPGYRMFSCGRYPTVQPIYQGGFSILGDVIQVSPQKLTELDAYEEIETGEYERIWDEKHAFWIYVMGKHPAKIFFPIDTGIWNL